MDIMPPDNQLPPHHAPTGLKLWLAVFAVVLVVALSYLVWASNTAPDTTDNSAVVTKKTTTDETADWKMFTDTTTGFTFIYPPAAQLTTASSKTEDNKTTRIYVKAYNLSTMADEPLGYDKVTLTALRDDLISGKVKTYLAGAYAKETLTLRQLEVCDVQFRYSLDVFDGKDILAHLDYSVNAGQEATVAKANPSYFTADAVNCSSLDIWKDTGEETFRTDLIAGKTDSVTQQWHKDFALIAKSFKFTN